MNVQRELRNHLQQYFPQDVRREPECSCGDPNHARILLFRVNGLPASAIVPEGYELSAPRLSHALAGARVEPMLESELDAIFPVTEIGRTEPFENPFGTAVYLDENLLQFPTVVFCPKMLSGKRGECFRLPIRDFQELVHPVVVRLTPPAPPISGMATW
jgi:prolyl-tRNA editing enzyme YbaK/EbsC (Cys-tRNA(Pro) deacylase)